MPSKKTAPSDQELLYQKLIATIPCAPNQPGFAEFMPAGGLC